jgi:hypothetical protein
VQLSVKVSYLGRDYELAFSSDVTEDLTRFDVGTRIAGVMQRELQRFAEISAVGLQDLTAAQAAEKDARERKARGEVVVKGPAIVLAAGTKAPEGRVILGEVKE